MPFVIREIILNIGVQNDIGEIVGKYFETLSYGKCLVTDYNNYMDITVLFDNPYYETKTRLDHLQRGLVKNPFYPKVRGVGYIGVGKFNSKHPSYKHWVRLFRRVYDEIDNYNSAYRDVSICEEWYNFQNFAAWCEIQKFFGAEDSEGKPYQLDKDILVKGNKVYSPETCCFVPHKINTLLITRKAARGGCPIGVTYNKRDKVFKALISCEGEVVNLGQSKCVEKAFNLYKKAKEKHIKEVAELWKDRIDERVYQALLNYEVHIDD